MATSTMPHPSGEPEESAQHGGLHLPAVRMPGGTAGRVLWWGGLAAVAAFGVVDWPVAALVAAGSWVAEQYAKSAARPPEDDREAGHSRRPAGGERQAVKPCGAGTAAGSNQHRNHYR